MISPTQKHHHLLTGSTKLNFWLGLPWDSESLDFAIDKAVYSAFAHPEHRVDLKHQSINWDVASQSQVSRTSNIFKIVAVYRFDILLFDNKEPQ